jgi:hypothetical protein
MRTVAQADTIVIKLRYETTSAFTSTGGAASYVQIKGNSIWRPYVGNTDSVGGYARMMADYEYSEVLESKVTVRLWGGVSGQDEPYRIAIVPCAASQYSVYSGFSNVAQLYDVPHSRQALFSPGGALPQLTSQGTTQALLFGNSDERGQEFAAGGPTTYGALTGTDPTRLWYFLIGYQNMAGTTTTNQQAQVSIEYLVKFILPVATPVQVARNRFGNEEILPAEEQKALREAGVPRRKAFCAPTEDAKAGSAVSASESKGSKVEEKGALGTNSRTPWSVMAQPKPATQVADSDLDAQEETLFAAVRKLTLQKQAAFDKLPK